VARSSNSVGGFCWCARGEAGELWVSAGRSRSDDRIYVRRPTPVRNDGRQVHKYIERNIIEWPLAFMRGER
jgi:hypothetical protein